MLLPLLLAAQTVAPADGPLAPHLEARGLATTRVFDGGRFPNVVVLTDGALLLTWGSSGVTSRRSDDGGETWGDPVSVAAPGFQGGGTLVDEASGDVLAWVEAHHPPAELWLYRSQDRGDTWARVEYALHPDAEGREPSMHMNEAGLTLVRGEHAGRLIRPSRWYAGANDAAKWPEHLTNAVYSDDGGATWHTSAPFPERGLGEAAIVELSDGRLYYNSRAHWPEADTPTRRRHAWSDDGGATWTGRALVDALPDGRQDRAYGCMGGLTRLPVDGRDVLLFSNLDTDRGVRERITVWASFDGGRTWPVKRLVHAGSSAYSSLAAGRPGTPSEAFAYLFFEEGGGASVARFDLAWVLGGEATGDGAVPDWVTPGEEDEDA